MNLKVMQVSEPETWRFHPVYSKYSISSHGRVYSFKQHKIIRHRINYSSRTRKVVAAIHNLSINSKPISLRVHTLVANVLLPPKPSPIHTIDHIDRNPLNNYYKNLRWATPKEQSDNQTKRIYKNSEEGDKRDVVKKRERNSIVVNEITMIEAISKRIENELYRQMGVEYGIPTTTIRRLLRNMHSIY